MYLEINGDRPVCQLQKNFSALFPYLKIEFFKCECECAHEDHYPGKEMIPSTWLLKEAWIPKKDKGLLKVCECMTVTDVENALLEEYGLTAHIYRYSGNLWLKTIMNGTWTLKQQNESCFGGLMPCCLS